MGSARPEFRGLVRILDEDPDLAGGLAGHDRAAARLGIVAPQLALPVGSYQPDEFESHEDQVGLLVLEGMLVREVVVAGRLCGELLDGGSLVQPWDRTGELAPLPYDICWRVLEPTRVALLTDNCFLTASARWPAVSKALLQRAIDRSQRLALSVAIHSLEHVELRLLVLLWHLADRFGRVTRAGTVIPVALTHEDLGKLVGAQRPTVSRAVTALTSKGQLRRENDRTWVLIGDPPAEVQDLRARRTSA